MFDLLNSAGTVTLHIKRSKGIACEVSKLQINLLRPSFTISLNSSTPRQGCQCHNTLAQTSNYGLKSFSHEGPRPGTIVSATVESHPSND